jgi:hypothetical protein
LDDASTWRQITVISALQPSSKAELEYQFCEPTPRTRPNSPRARRGIFHELDGTIRGHVVSAASLRWCSRRRWKTALLHFLLRFLAADTEI